MSNTKFINWKDHSDKALRVAGSILVPRATRLFLNYVSCSSGNGQTFIFFDWPIQTVCVITLRFFGSVTHNVLFPVELIRALILEYIDMINFHAKNVA